MKFIMLKNLKKRKVPEGVVLEEKGTSSKNVDPKVETLDETKEVVEETATEASETSQPITEESNDDVSSDSKKKIKTKAFSC